MWYIFFLEQVRSNINKSSLRVCLRKYLTIKYICAVYVIVRQTFEAAHEQTVIELNVILLQDFV